MSEKAFDRDAGGRLVRDAWISWASVQPAPKESWLLPYDELSEPDKEADRIIAEWISLPLIARAERAEQQLAAEREAHAQTRGDRDNLKERYTTMTGRWMNCCRERAATKDALGKAVELLHFEATRSGQELTQETDDFLANPLAQSAGAQHDVERRVIEAACNMV